MEVMLLAEIKVVLGDNGQAAEICGYQDRYLQTLEKGLKVQILARGGELTINGEDDAVAEAEKVLRHLQTLAAADIAISPLTVNYALSSRREDKDDIAALLTRNIFITPRGRAIKPKSFGQWQYLKAIDEHDIVFAIGPAGTGKTFLAVLKAAEALKNRTVVRLVLARPAVEAGEKLGFLPGDLQDKVNPYLRPVYDALDEALGVDQAQKLIARNIIEVVPLAYMRGRTLDDAYIILDEAQNTTPQQMKMFLTRIGQGSRAVITGDITQIDLPPGQTSGLIEAERRLRDIEELAFCYLTRVDVVRHHLVQKIIEAYERKWV
jgi:phosphate starvation-inducible protein PhoH and related proteins